MDFDFYQNLLIYITPNFSIKYEPTNPEPPIISIFIQSIVIVY